MEHSGAASAHHQHSAHPKLATQTKAPPVAQQLDGDTQSRRPPASSSQTVSTAVGADSRSYSPDTRSRESIAMASMPASSKDSFENASSTMTDGADSTAARAATSTASDYGGSRNVRRSQNTAVDELPPVELRADAISNNAIRMQPKNTLDSRDAGADCRSDNADGSSLRDNGAVESTRQPLALQPIEAPRPAANNGGSPAEENTPPSHEDYEGAIAAYYDDYLPIVESAQTHSTASDAPSAIVQNALKQHAGASKTKPPAPSPHAHLSALTSLRSTYKSEPMMHTMKRNATTSDINAAEGIRNSYSQTLENALFYSQAIEQIRECDTIDSSNPYATAVPRARPGKDDIRQRRARNAIASREVFSIVTPSTYIPIPSDRMVPAFIPEEMPPLTVALAGGPRPMRSEPVFKTSIKERQASGKSNGKGGGKIVIQEPSDANPSAIGSSIGGGGSSSLAVPLTRFLPRQQVSLSKTQQHSELLDSGPGTRAAVNGYNFSSSDRHDHLANDWDVEMRSGLDQPLASSDHPDEELKRRGVPSPRSAIPDGLDSPTANMARSGMSRSRTNSIAESGALGSDSEVETRRERLISRSRLPQSSAEARNRRSVASQFSLVAESTHSSLANAYNTLQSYRRNHGHSHNNNNAHHSHHVLSSQSKYIAMRLLTRAGFSRVAIRVARMGSSHKEAHAHDAEDSTPSSLFDVDAGISGLDLDPNGLQSLKAARRKQVKRVDEHGFLEFEGDDERGSEYVRQYESWRARNPAKTGRPTADMSPDSEDRWETLLDSFDSTMLRSSRKIKQLVQAGMPPRMRARIYYKFSGAGALEEPGKYGRLLALDSIPIYDVIERDVSRCYPDHIMFADADGQGQRQLRRILRAYAQFNPTIGYCQGMGRLVGLFLIIGLSEEQAFWVLAATIKNYIPKYYESDLGGLRVHTAVFEALLRERSPRLHAHLSEQGCDALMYATPWFMTVFTLSLPWETALRVWDWFMYRGTKILFRAALAITDLAGDYLLEACPTIAEQLGFLLHIPPSLVGPDALIGAAIRVKLSERHIERLTHSASAATLGQAAHKSN
ncbi:hypothetical protein GGI07_004794 [Coemansia sp. Benny D115]|nr:hypothetical protein GGI07_004794 [Coemansia sp. Benny D115]